MNACGVLVALVMVFCGLVDGFTIKDLKNGELLATECIIEVGINPLAVNRLRKGDLSRVDEKSQVRLTSDETLRNLQAFLHLLVLREMFLREKRLHGGRRLQRGSRHRQALIARDQGESSGDLRSMQGTQRCHIMRNGLQSLRMLSHPSEQ